MNGEFLKNNVFFFNKICFDVNENDFSLLIGKKGKNINLLSKIIGCHLEINSKNKENSNRFKIIKVFNQAK